jgi:hypothetical protein
MVKRVFFLFLLSWGAREAVSSQVFKMDSIESSIVIPDHHKKSLISHQSIAIDEINTKFLDNLLQVDSLYPETHSFSSGRIKIDVGNYLNKRWKSKALYYYILDRLLLSPSPEKPFNPYSLVYLWKSSREYKPFALSLKYREISYKPITRYKQKYRVDGYKKYRHFLQHPAGADTFMVFTQQEPIKKIMERKLIDHPSMTEELWDNIPDPPKVGKGYIKKRTANEGINRLMQWKNPDTKGQLDKKKDIERTWNYKGTENIQLSQAYIDNWVKGGENSIALLSDLRIQAGYKKSNVEWDSYAIHKLGILNSEEKKTRFNDDLIELNTKYGLSAGKKWFYSGFMNFKTQFFNGYDSKDVDKESPVSGFMAPGYLTLALGMDYKDNDFTLMLSPFTSKITMVLDTAKVDQTKYDIPEDKKIDNTGGASVVNNLIWKISNDFNLTSNLDFFYGYMKSDNQIQAEWEVILDMKINIFLSTRISANMRYYTNELEKVQLKENLSISFNYSF